MKPKSWWEEMVPIENLWTTCDRFYLADTLKENKLAFGLLSAAEQEPVKPFDPTYAPPGFVAVKRPDQNCGGCDAYLHDGDCCNKWCINTHRPDGHEAVLKRKPAPAEWGEWVECETSRQVQSMFKGEGLVDQLTMCKIRFRNAGGKP